MLKQNNKTPKQLLAAVRSGDYAHPGEEEAIHIAMKYMAKVSHQLLLDVGCGLGGTAKYIKESGYGIPYGIDIDKSAIEYAKQKYSDIEFELCDVSMATKTLMHKSFDVIYLFNSFYAFKDQECALNELSKLSKDSTQLIIFDYMMPSILESASSPFAPDGSIFARPNFIPLYENNIESLLLRTGWQMESLINMGAEYIIWYRQFVFLLEQQKDKLISEFGHHLYEWAQESYSDLLYRLENKTVSGALIIAKKSASDKNKLRSNR